MKRWVGVQSIIAGGVTITAAYLLLNPLLLLGLFALAIVPCIFFARCAIRWRRSTKPVYIETPARWTPKRFKRGLAAIPVAIALALASFVVYPAMTRAQAQQSSEEAAEVAQLEQMMRAQFGLFARAQAQVLQDEEIPKGIAAFYGNLYRALQDEGFTKEQAMDIVLETTPSLMSNPSMWLWASEMQ